MTKQRIHDHLGTLEIATPDDINEVLSHRFDAYLRDRYRTIKIMKLPIITAQAAAAGNLTLTNPSQQPWCGPDSGFMWALRRVTVTSSGGYIQAVAGASSFPVIGSGSVATPGALANIASITLPATNIALNWTINWPVGITTATAAVANNMRLVVGATVVGGAIQATAIGNYPQVAIQYTQPAGGSVIVKVQSIGADATGTYTAQVSASLNAAINQVGAGDLAQVNYLYAGSDLSANQNSILSGSIPMGQAWFPAKEGAWLFPGEQLYATLSNVTAGNTYTITGVAIEVAAEMVGKLIG
jgi:hypothetical protein